MSLILEFCLSFVIDNDGPAYTRLSRGFEKVLKMLYIILDMPDVTACSGMSLDFILFI